MYTIESAATAQAATGRFYAEDRLDWPGFTGLLAAWIKNPAFTHTHYLTDTDYQEAFDYIFLQIAALRKKLITVDITDTGDGDEIDQITLTHTSKKKFKIRPI